MIFKAGDLVRVMPNVEPRHRPLVGAIGTIVRCWKYAVRVRFSDNSPGFVFQSDALDRVSAVERLGAIGESDERTSRT